MCPRNLFEDPCLDILQISMVMPRKFPLSIASVVWSVPGVEGYTVPVSSIGPDHEGITDVNIIWLANPITPCVHAYKGVLHFLGVFDLLKRPWNSIITLVHLINLYERRGVIVVITRFLEVVLGKALGKGNLPAACLLVVLVVVAAPLASSAHISNIIISTTRRHGCSRIKRQGELDAETSDPNNLSC